MSAHRLSLSSIARVVTECEALCGRIGVMVDGALRCLGPIQSLKTRYGQGYKLDLRLDPAKADTNAILKFVKVRRARVHRRHLYY